MDKESNSLGYLYEVIGEVFGDELDTIKQALKDKEKRIKKLEQGVGLCNNQAKVQHEQDMKRINLLQSK